MARGADRRRNVSPLRSGDIYKRCGFEVHSINLDAQKVKWNNERHILVLKHANERTSIIKYWPENSPFLIRSHPSNSIRKIFSDQRFCENRE